MYKIKEHFFLLKDTQPGHADYNNIAGKTALHFNNPFYLNYILHKKEDPKINDNFIAVEEVNEEAMKIASPLTLPTKAVNDSAEEAMIFEPLYTTDYFASQGIKLSEEIKADDKLGKHLKSFTEWLKTMKKVHNQNMSGNEPLDLNVQNIAEKSNKETEIITESMAEVYISQGKLKKAAEIYQKLSLLNPSKSAYFAAKTDHLKEK